MNTNEYDLWEKIIGKNVSDEKDLWRRIPEWIRYLMRNSNIICDISSVVFYIKKEQGYFEKLKNADELIEKFNKNSIGSRNIKKLRRRMATYELCGCVSLREFLLLGFINLSKSKQKSFLSEWDKIALCMKHVGLETFELLKNKAKTAKIFAEFYKRGFYEVNSKDDFLGFLDFCKNKKEIVVKPLRGGGGKGIALVSIDENNIEQVFNDYFYKYGEFLVEEKIKQCQELSNWGSDSVNTVRISTIISKDKVVIYKPFVRIGKRGNFVDNCSLGGLVAFIDSDSGVLITDGMDFFGNTHTYHPDSQIKFIGWQIPKWKEAIDLVNKLAYIIPNNKYVSWDLALTDKGWVIIEGNWGSVMGYQMCPQKGCKVEFTRLLEGN